MDHEANSRSAASSDTPTGRGTVPAEAPPARGGDRLPTWQGFANRIVRALLRTPLVCRVMGRRLIIVYVVGRKTGRRYTVPVAYTHHDGMLLIGSPFGWARNLRTGEAVDIRLKGRRRPVAVRVHADEVGVVELYGVMARDNRQFARLNDIGLDPEGDPDPADLRSAWVTGARAIHLVPC